MSPQLITLIIALVQEAITLEPTIASELQTLFAKKNPTPADWEALRQSILAKSYAEYVPASALPKTSQPGSGGINTAASAPNALSGNPGAISGVVQDQKSIKS